VKKKRSIRLLILTGSFLCIILGLLLTIPIPYFVIQPGSAIAVAPLVQVGNTRPDEKGVFFLTTVSMRDGKWIDYIYARLSDEIELVPENQILAQNESEKEYERRQQENMLASQNQAIIAAFRFAGRPVSVQSEGVEVFQLVKTRPGGLKEGDLIQQVDGRPVRSPDELIQYLSGKKPGDVVRVSVVRDHQPLTLNVSLISLPSEKGKKPRAGFGIIPLPRVRVKTDPTVKIRAGDIGGPSAGLMFALEVLNRLLPEDLTKGYKVAGTGTISETGEVGQIGGIQHKIVAAEKEGAQIFFCPRDRKPGDDNEKTAKETVKKLGLSMKVVPVSTLDEAVRYLRGLPKAHTSSFKAKTLTDIVCVSYNNSVFTRGVEAC
jgi:PDZ domain-containing protein